ncbi:MAG: flagellin [Fibromonadaceae bacterium]|nr:flagellin [Fibromonadaceae bacterium]
MSSSKLFSVSSMMHQSQLRLHNKDFTRAMERLATGARINQAKDDPFRNYEIKNVNSEISRIGKATQNTTDGASLLQIADGTCNEVHGILQRVRELAVQSANDTLSSTERFYLDQEAEGLLKEMDRIAMSSIFNSKQIFGNKGDSFSEEERDLRDWKPFTSIDKDRNPTRPGVLHIGYANGKMDEMKISIPEISAKSLGLDTTLHTYIAGVDMHTYAFSLSTQRGATRAIDDVDFALNSVTTVRTYLGAIVSRLDMHTDDLQDKDIHLSKYSSEIMDADVAKESTVLASSQIKQQAAISILSQCNARIGKVLEMLG